jgi:hypothetical protein
MINIQPLVPELYAWCDVLPDFDKIQDGVQVLKRTLVVVLSVFCD